MARRAVVFAGHAPWQQVPRHLRARRIVPAVSIPTTSRNSGIRSFSTRYVNPHLRRPSSKEPSEQLTNEAPEPPVISLPPSKYALHCNEVHCFLGVNGSGKSRLLQQIQDSAAASALAAPTGRRVRVGTLSFDAHRAFVREHGHKVVADVLGGIGSRDARDLIVRLGLFPVWDSHIRHLSTGELRKVLLAVALLQIPRATVLILDQPFDGLDTKARAQLEWMLGQLTRGFTRLLVDTGGRNEAFAYKTQVLLVANRLDQVVPDILTHVVLLKKQAQAQDGDGSSSSDVEIIPWENPEENPDLMRHRLEAFFYEHSNPVAEEGEAEDQKKQQTEKMKSLVDKLYGYAQDPLEAPSSSPVVAVQLTQLSVAYGRRLLLEDVNFERHRHAHWVLLGPNGSGKSSLMRVLMQQDGHGQVAGEVTVNGDRVAVVSTDLHLQMLENEAHKDRTAQDWLEEACQGAGGLVEVVLELLRVPRELLARKFCELSQGEQKMVQIACAIVARPDVLILDEITHGLDLWNRQRVLDVVDAIGRFASRFTHLVLITHHEDEIGACFTDVFEIKGQQLCRVERS